MLQFLGFANIFLNLHLFFKALPFILFPSFFLVWHFSTIGHLLVTLHCLTTQKAEVARFACNVECDFMWFLNVVHWWKTRTKSGEKPSKAKNESSVLMPRTKVLFSKSAPSPPPSTFLTSNIWVTIVREALWLMHHLLYD